MAFHRERTAAVHRRLRQPAPTRTSIARPARRPAITTTAIGTLDNPGWFLRVDLHETALDGVAFSPYEVRRSNNDWVIARVADRRFEASCGPLNLGEAIHQFRLWATEQWAGPHSVLVQLK